MRSEEDAPGPSKGVFKVYEMLIYLYAGSAN